MAALRLTESVNFSGSWDRQVARSGAEQDAVDIVRGAAENIRIVGRVSHQPAARRENLAAVDRRQPIACHLCDQKIAMLGEERVKHGDDPGHRAFAAAAATAFSSSAVLVDGAGATVTPRVGAAAWAACR